MPFAQPTATYVGSTVAERNSLAVSALSAAAQQEGSVTEGSVTVVSWYHSLTVYLVALFADYSCNDVTACPRVQLLHGALFVVLLLTYAAPHWQSAFDLGAVAFAVRCAR